VLLGDGESPKDRSGKRPTSRVDKLDNLCGITDVNALGRAADDVAARHGQFDARWQRVRLARDRHRRPRHAAILDAFAERAAPRAADDDPRADLKGKGVSFVEGKDGWHGKAFKKGDELDTRSASSRRRSSAASAPAPDLIRSPQPTSPSAGTAKRAAAPDYKLGDRSRRAKRSATRSPSWHADPRVVALDADVKNSTFSERFEKVRRIASTRTSSPSR
jgi:transketolase